MNKEKESSRDTVVLRVYSQQVVDAVIHVMGYVLPAAQAIQPLDVTESGCAIFVIYSSKDADYNNTAILYADSHNTTEERQRLLDSAYTLNANVVCIHNYEHVVTFVKDYCALITNIIAFREGSFIYRNKPAIEATVLLTRRQLIAKVRKLLNEADVIESEKIQTSLRKLKADYVKEQQPDIHEPVDNIFGDASIIIHVETDAALVRFKALIEYLGLFTASFVYDDLGNGIGAARILSTSEAELGIKNDGVVVYSYAERAKYEHQSFNDCERVILDTGKSFRQFVVNNHAQLRRLSLMCENYNNTERTNTVRSYIELLEAVDKILKA